MHTGTLRHTLPSLNPMRTALPASQCLGQACLAAAELSLPRIPVHYVSCMSACKYCNEDAPLMMSLHSATGVLAGQARRGPAARGGARPVGGAVRRMGTAGRQASPLRPTRCVPDQQSIRMLGIIWPALGNSVAGVRKLSTTSGDWIVPERRGPAEHVLRTTHVEAFTWHLSCMVSLLQLGIGGESAVPAVAVLRAHGAAG